MAEGITAANTANTAADTVRITITTMGDLVVRIGGATGEDSENAGRGINSSATIAFPSARKHELYLGQKVLFLHPPLLCVQTRTTVRLSNPQPATGAGELRAVL